MKLCNVNELKGGDILAQPVLTADYKILLSEGTILNCDYIKKLKDFYIEEVFIKVDRALQENLLIQDIELIYKDKVRSILERHIYHKNTELIELVETADKIIGSILQEKKVIERIYEIKERDSNVYEHSISLCSISVLTSLKLNLELELIHDIGVACLLHDLGLRYMTLTYTNMDITILPSHEVAEYKKHPVNAYSALANEDWISERSKKIILNHHENIDGSGYPLKIRELSLESRIVNVCDTFDEMICGIGYERKKVYEAVKELKKFKNIKYDDIIVDVFLQLAAVFPVGCHVRTNQGEIGIVFQQNNEYPDKPYIKIVRDKKGNTVLHDVVKDLSGLKNVFIEDVIDNL